MIPVLMGVMLLGSVVAWWATRSREHGEAKNAEEARVAASGPHPTDQDARAPDHVRIRVRVVNATNTNGLARRATLLLRDLGYDVVDYDTDSRHPRLQTVVMSHTGHGEWAERMRRAMGATTSAESRPDSLRFVDLSVYVGSDWKAPTQPLRP